MVDLRKMAPADLVRLLNTVGEAGSLSTRKLYEHRQAAGYRIGADKTVNLARYAAWLIDNRHSKAPARTKEEQYERRKEAARSRQAQMARSGRDIGPLPELTDPERRAACAMDLRCFCETYLSATFYMGWSDDHLRAIAKTEHAVLKGGLFALAMPRGSGKSSLSEAAALWAMIFGHRRFIFIVGAEGEAAKEMLESIKIEIESNTLLAEDFPEVCYPIERLEGIVNRSAGQTLDGKRTRISWTADEICLPTVHEKPGAIVRVAGITGRIRGAKYKRSDGEPIRPDLVIVDDPQTDASARSVSQSATRERTLAGAVLGLAGPGKKISGMMPCTVVVPGDMADRILSKELHPEWSGERTKLVYDFPTNKELWNKYAEIRADNLRRDNTITEATAFYEKHQTEMDVGAKISWPERFNSDEISGIQYAMNLLLQDEESFWAEYQNEPMSTKEEEHQLTADEIGSKVNGYAQASIPTDVSRVTAFVDVQGALLYYVVCGWTDDFTGYVLDYGTYPEQNSRYFTLRQVKDNGTTIFDTAPGSGQEGAWYQALQGLTDQLCNTKWLRDDGSWAAIERLLIDANYGESTDLVYQFCRESDHAKVIHPSHGQYVGAKNKQFSDFSKRRGERLGLNWRMPPPKEKKIRYVLYDTNWWKTFIHNRLGMTHGDRGSLSLYKGSLQHHRQFSEHCSAEYREKVTARERTVYEWQLPPSKPDNHWWDCLVGSAVAASIAGAQIPEIANTVKKTEKSIKLSELRKQKRGHRA